jgi:hypothetical protein
LRLLIVSRSGKQSRDGPVVSEHEVAPGNTIKVRVHRQRVVTRTSTISDALREATAQRILDALSTTVSAELKAKAAGISGSVKTGMTAKSEQEVTRQVERTLTVQTSHSVEDLEGQEHEIELSGVGAAADRRVQLRRRYWPKHWEIYLHSFDYLELSYRERWLWSDIRKTMKAVHGQELKIPLVSLTFYEPQADLVVSHQVVANELENPDGFEVNALTTVMPEAAAPRLLSLEEAAKLAFPTSRAEKKAAKTHKGPAHGLALASKKKRGGVAKAKAAKKQVGRKAPKRAAAKRKAPKKKVARKRAK